MILTVLKAVIYCRIPDLGKWHSEPIVHVRNLKKSEDRGGEWDEGGRSRQFNFNFYLSAA